MATQSSPAPKKGVKARAATVISIPRDGNRIYGDDVPMPWREAAAQTGIPANSFWLLLQSRQIEKQPVGKRVMVTPSAIRAYLARVKVPAL